MIILVITLGDYSNDPDKPHFSLTYGPTGMFSLNITHITFKIVVVTLCRWRLYRMHWRWDWPLAVWRTSSATRGRLQKTMHAAGNNPNHPNNPLSPCICLFMVNML